MKKKLKKLQTGTDEGVDQEGHSSSPSQSQSKGQWERRLQTDIQMAKQALSEALSLHKPTHVFPETKPLTSHIHPSPYPTKPNPSCSYASSYENISRLLENWTKTPNSAETNTPNSFSNNMVTTGSSSSDGAHSTTNACTPPDHAFDSLLSFNSSKSDGSRSVYVVEESNNLRANCFFQDHQRKTNVESHQVPLTFLENWLFDDGAAQCHEDLMNMSLEGSGAGLF